MLDFSRQEGTLEACAAGDFFTATTTVSVAGSSAYADNMGMKRHIAFAHFDLVFPDGVEFAGNPVRVSGEGVNSTANVTMTNGVSFNAGDITVGTESKDFYMTLLPTKGEKVAPEFRTVVDGKVYKGTLQGIEIAPSAFIRKAHGEGVEVQMELTDEDPYNPGDFANWAAGIELPDLIETGTGFAKTGASKDAWCHNYYTDVDDDFGFATPYIYPANGVTNGGLLTSCHYGTPTDPEAKYFQWGRWLGFPMGVVYADVAYFGGYYCNEKAQYPRGVSELTAPLYYCWDMDSRATYAYITDTGWNKTQAVNSSIIFGVDEFDYMANGGDEVWTDRSANPCPDGYSVPTMYQMDIFVPDNVDSFGGSYAEVKEKGGRKFAVRWTVTSGTTVEVRSVETNKTTVTADDAIFNDAPAVTLYADGMLYPHIPGNDNWMDTKCVKWASSFGGEKTSGYWTNESAQWADGKWGAVAMMVRIKNGTAAINFEVTARTYGLYVKPIMSGGKSGSIKPYFPKGYW